MKPDYYDILGVARTATDARPRSNHPAYRRSVRYSGLTVSGFIQTVLTFSPLGPFGPCPRSKVTACPSRSSSNRV